MKKDKATAAPKKNRIPKRKRGIPPLAIRKRVIVEDPQAHALAKKFEDNERRYRVTCYKRDGYDNYEIAKEMQISVEQVKHDLRHCIDLAAKEYTQNAEFERQLQLERLDKLIKVNMPLATETNREIRIDKSTGEEVIVITPPNPANASVILAVETRRAKLLALDVPEVRKVEVTGIRQYVGVDMDKV